MEIVDLPTTNPTLLQMLALPECNNAWELFIGHYSPLILARCKKVGLQPADADDIQAMIFAGLVEAMRSFHYDPARRFRGYLQRVVDNAIRTHWRILNRRPGWIGVGGDTAEGPPEALAGLGAELENQIHDEFEQASATIERVREEVGSVAWEAFWLTAIDGLTGAEAAERLKTTPAAVYMAKCRVRARLRDQLAAAPSDA